MPEPIALIIPAAGRGSRFSALGIREPKPLIDLQGRPFFWWAVESVRRMVPIRQMVFVVLEEHIAEFNIDQRIRSYYPEATVVALPELTSGAAETAQIGVSALTSPGPMAINDCDHAFLCGKLPSIVEALQGGMEGALMCFRSQSPAYSYVKLDADCKVIGTVEKQVVSPFAIAGCYLFADPARFLQLYERYKIDCPYNELFLSGMFNPTAGNRLDIGMLELDRHISFGTPDEQKSINDDVFLPFLSWK